MFNKNFDIEALKIKSCDVPAPSESGIQTVRPQRPRKGHFIKLPLEWVYRLDTARCVATSKVAHHLLHRSFKDRRQTIRLASGVLALKGVSRDQKWRALAELEVLGLISVERRPRKSPIVTLLYPAEGE
jgi:hypothetical protein